MKNNKYMAIYAMNDKRIQRHFGVDFRKLLASCKAKIKSANAQKAWIEVYTASGELIAMQFVDSTTNGFQAV